MRSYKCSSCAQRRHSYCIWLLSKAFSASRLASLWTGGLLMAFALCLYRYCRIGSSCSTLHMELSRRCSLAALAFSSSQVLLAQQECPHASLERHHQQLVYLHHDLQPHHLLMQVCLQGRDHLSDLHIQQGQRCPPLSTSSLSRKLPPMHGQGGPTP